MKRNKRLLQHSKASKNSQEQDGNQKNLSLEKAQKWRHKSLRIDFKTAYHFIHTKWTNWWNMVMTGVTAQMWICTLAWMQLSAWKKAENNNKS